ncbi:MAG: glycosyltransferase family 39 protein [Candidatus Saccharibacteria bacterium]|nr:glycosyltransferase family 39 protein [Candidatus Saccharibacteria bacterium]
MKTKRTVQNSPIYQHRYHIVGALLAVMAIFMAVYNFWSLPAGLTQVEMESAATSGNLSLSALLTPTANDNWQFYVGLPWLIVQGASIKLFGLSAMAIRLPAVLLAITSVGLIIWLLKRLLKPSSAMMGGLLLVSSAFMISLARSGIPAIMTVLLMALLCLLGHGIINSKQHRGTRMILVGVVAGLLCYVPAGVYIVIAMSAIGLAHPKSRLVLKTHKKCLSLEATAFIASIAPLLYAIITTVLAGKYSLINQLLFVGAPSVDNLRTLANAYAGPQAIVLGGLLTPMLTIVGLVMVFVGWTILTKDAVASIRSYLTIGLMLVGIALGICNPDFVYVLFIPAVILETICLSYLTDKWYKLFPSNPYARVFGILPLAILIGSLSAVDMDRYFNMVSYSKDVVYQYDQTLPQVQSLISHNRDQEYALVVPSSDYDLYRQFDSNKIKTYAKDKLTQQDLQDINKNTQVVVLGKVEFKDPKAAKLVRIAADWRKDSAPLFKVYEK